MSDELMYTSAPRGLRTGASGFCTVAATAGLSPAWVQRLESLSGYKPLYPAGDPNEGANPVSFAHARLSVGGRSRSVLSRVCFSGFDHTGRSNKFGHHVVLDDDERAVAGPAAMLRAPGLMSDRWDGGEPRTLPARSVPRIGQGGPRVASTWQALVGDAGWAGHLASMAADDVGTVVYIVYPRDADVLALIDEAICLLPTTRRWQVTFNTYLTEAPSGIACAWRCVMADAPAAAMARGNVIDLTNLPASPPEHPYVEAARTGRAPVEATGSNIASAIEAGPRSAIGTRPAAAARSAAIPIRAAGSGATGRPPRAIPMNVVMGVDDHRERRIPIWPFLLGGSIAAAAVVVLLVVMVPVKTVASATTGSDAVGSTEPTSDPATVQLSPTSEPALSIGCDGGTDRVTRATPVASDESVSASTTPSTTNPADQDSVRIHAIDPVAPNGSLGDQARRVVRPASTEAVSNALDDAKGPATREAGEVDAVTARSQRSIQTQAALEASTTSPSSDRNNPNVSTTEGAGVRIGAVRPANAAEPSSGEPTTGAAADVRPPASRKNFQWNIAQDEKITFADSGTWRISKVSNASGEVWRPPTFSEEYTLCELQHQVPKGLAPPLKDLGEIGALKLVLRVEGGNTLTCTLVRDIANVRSAIDQAKRLPLPADSREKGIVSESLSRAEDAYARLCTTDVAQISVKLIDPTQPMKAPITVTFTARTIRG